MRGPLRSCEGSHSRHLDARIRRCLRELTPRFVVGHQEGEMAKRSERYFAAVLGFGFIATWVAAGLGSALGCLCGAAVAYGLASFAQGRAGRIAVSGEARTLRVGLTSVRS